MGRQLHDNRITALYCRFSRDDGFTGTNFNRPDFARMIEKVEQDKIGHLFFGMTAHRSFKDKTMIDVPEDQWIKCMDNHEPLVSEDVFKKVQELSKISHKVIRFAPEENIYNNISYCADCGFRMYFSSRPF